MKTKSFCMLALVIVFSGFAPSFVQAQVGASDLKKQKISIKADKMPLAKVFQKLIYEIGIPIGFEMSLLDSQTRDFDFETNLPAYMVRNSQSPSGEKGLLPYEVHWEKDFTAESHFITLDFENAPIDKIFDSIVEQMSNYKWKIANDVVNIYPKDGRDPRFVDLMELKVKEFLLVSKAPLIIIQTVIYDLPEFEKFLAERNLGVTGVRYDAQNLKRIVPQGMRLSDIKLKEILNDLAKMKGGGWILRTKTQRSKDGKEIIEIDI